MDGANCLELAQVNRGVMSLVDKTWDFSSCKMVI